MVVKQDTKTKAKQIVALLPKTNCGKCGYDNCGKFAKAVAEGNASPFGCRENTAAGYKISEILGIEVPQQQADNIFLPHMTIPFRTRRVFQTERGAQRRGRYGHGNGSGASRGRGRFKEASCGTKQRTSSAIDSIYPFTPTTG